MLLLATSSPHRPQPRTPRLPLRQLSVGVSVATSLATSPPGADDLRAASGIARERN